MQYPQLGSTGDAGWAVEAVGLVKRYRKVTALDGLDLQVPAGGVYGLLGPNGAGKTTTIRILATLLRPDRGTAWVFGHDTVADADEVRTHISLTGQFATVDEDLTGHENLVLLGRLLGHRPPAAARRADELLDAFGLTEATHRVVKHYSGGMRRRLDIAASIVVTPRLLFLDEPTAGLDPRSRNQVWKIARALVAGGTTIVLTTQYLDEADALADRVAVVDHGRVIAEGTTAELKASVGARTIHVRVHDPAHREPAAELLARALAGEIARGSDPAVLSARAEEPRRAADALALLTRSGIEITAFSLGQPSLDEVFLTLTGRSAGDPAVEAEVPA